MPTVTDQLCLLEAIARNDTETVQFLIFGQLVCPDFVLHGKSPIVVAAINGREEVLDILIQSSCDLTTPDFSHEVWRKQPIHIASAKGYVGFVKKLVDNGVSVSSLDEEKKTPLHLAALFGHVSVAEYLLSAGALVNATQDDGFTPLHCSATLGHNELCEILLLNGADPNATDEEGWTPVHHAAAYGNCSVSVVKNLHKAGALLDMKTSIGDTALHIAACTSSENRVELLQYLTENNVPLNEQDGNERTALHIACFHNIFDNVKCLVELGAELHTIDDYGDSPLFSAACAYDSEGCLSLLIKAGYNCSKETWIHEDRFPLALANNMKMVSMLKFCASNPRTLQQLCCFCILASIGKQSSKKINLLPIPTSLKSFLSDVIK